MALLESALQRGASYAKAAAAAGVSVRSVRRWRQADPAVGARLEAAWREGVDANVDELEGALVERGLHGYAEGVWRRDPETGEQVLVEVRTKWTEKAALAYLRAHCPAYRAGARASVQPQGDGELLEAVRKGGGLAGRALRGRWRR